MHTEAQPGLFRRTLRIIHILEDGILALILSAMIALAFTQIALRNLFDTGLLWADPALKVMVLWLALLGALAATRERKHINIDVLSHVLPKRGQYALRAAGGLFTLCVSALIAYHGMRFVMLEFNDATTAFSGIPAWTLEAIIPFAFSLMALRFLIHSLSDLYALIAGEGKPWG